MRISDWSSDVCSSDLSGTLAPHLITHGKLQRLTDPRVEVNGDATYANRRVEGALSLRSSALAVDATGTIDLARSAYRNVRLRARLLKPPALFPNMTARNMEFRAILDGAFATASFANSSEGAACRETVCYHV